MCGPLPPSAERSTVLCRTKVLQVDRRGAEPRLPACQPGVFPLDQQPMFAKVTPAGVEPANSRGSRPGRFSEFAYLAVKWRVRTVAPAGRAL